MQRQEHVWTAIGSLGGSARIGARASLFGDSGVKGGGDMQAEDGVASTF